LLLSLSLFIRVSRVTGIITDIIITITIDTITTATGTITTIIAISRPIDTGRTADSS
jgi:hypothetical protein